LRTIFSENRSTLFERRRGGWVVFILPVVVSISFFLIADLDSPRGGAIRVHPVNLLAAAQSMKTP
jgi:hypothetical protein